MEIKHHMAYVVTHTGLNNDSDYDDPTPDTATYLGTFSTIEEAEAFLVTKLPNRFIDYRDTRMFLSPAQVSELKEFIDLTKLRRVKFIEHEDGGGSFDDEWIAYGDKDPLLTDEQKLRLHKMFGIREYSDYSEHYNIIEHMLVPTKVIR